MVTELEPGGEQKWTSRRSMEDLTRTHGVQETDRIVVKIPVQFRRRNGAQMIVATIRKSGKMEGQRFGISAITAAWKWRGELESGNALASRNSAPSGEVDRSYAGRLLKLTSLAPKILKRCWRARGLKA